MNDPRDLEKVSFGGKINKVHVFFQENNQIQRTDPYPW